MVGRAAILFLPVLPGVTRPACSPATAALSPCGPSTAGRPGRVVQSIPIFVESAQGSPWLAPGTARFVLEKWKGEGNTLDAGGSGEECIDTVQGAQGEECSSSLTGRITEMDDRYSAVGRWT